MVSFEDVVKLMLPSLTELKVTPSFCFAFKIPDEPTATTIYSNGTSKHFPNPFDEYTQSPIIRTSPIRLNPEILGKFKTRALDRSNLRTTSKNLRTASAQIFKAKNQVLLPFLLHRGCYEKK